MNKTRKIKIQGHDEYWEGYFHAWKQVDNLGLMAVVEDESGQKKKRPK